MRPPWWGYSRNEAELEALQTDIMRFMAILGLCLAAIFSLVQGVAPKQTVPDQPMVPQAQMELAAAEQVVPRQEIVESSDVEVIPVEPEYLEPANDSVPIAQPEQPSNVPVPPVVGFTLEFASVQALEILLRDNKVQLYARHLDQFWSVDSLGAVVSVAAPHSYYQMHTETVPRRLRSAIPGAGLDPAATWGVTLPPEVVDHIQQLTNGREGGNLLIRYDGSVAIDSSLAN